MSNAGKRVSSKSRVRARNPRGQGEQLRTELIEAAIRVLERLGAEEPFSIRAVASEAKVSATSLYLHFADRDELFMAVLERLFSEQIAIRDEAEAKAMKAGGGAWERLMARSLAAVEFALQRSGHYKVLYEGRVVTRMSDPKLKYFGRPLLVRSTELIKEIIKENPAERVTQNPERLSLLLWAAMHGVVSLRINKPMPDWPAPDELVRQMAIALIRPALERKSKPRQTGV